MKLKKCLVWAIWFFILACNNQKGFIINGEISGIPDSTMIYITNLYSTVTLDSSYIISGEFQLSGQLSYTPEELRLKTDVNNKPLSVDLLIGNEEVTVKGDATDFPLTLIIEGSKTQKERNALNNQIKKWQLERDSLMQSFFTNQDENRPLEFINKTWSRIKEIDNTIYSIRINFIKRNPESYTSLLIIKDLIYKLPKDSIEEYYRSLSGSLKNSRYAQVVNTYLRYPISNVGYICYDFEGYDVNGNSHHLYDTDAQYILLEFVGTFCGPCIQASKELHKINNEYSDKISIISFSTDPQKSVWLTGIKRDNVKWLSLWDGKGNESETCIKYGIRGVPSFFLLDSNFVLINKWIGYNKGDILNKIEALDIQE